MLPFLDSIIGLFQFLEDNLRQESYIIMTKHLAKAGICHHDQCIAVAKPFDAIMIRPRFGDVSEIYILGIRL